MNRLDRNTLTIFEGSRGTAKTRNSCEILGPLATALLITGGCVTEKTMSLEEGVVRSFVEKINAADMDGIAEGVTSRHVFTDTLGHAIRGREPTRKAWADYFAMIPDYTISIDECVADGESVALFGTASGTYAPTGSFDPNRHWQVYAAWRALVRNGRVHEWQVYADNKPVYEIISRDHNGSGP